MQMFHVLSPVLHWVFREIIWGHQKSVFFQRKISVCSSAVCHWAGLWTLCWTNPGSTGHHCPVFWGWWVQRKQIRVRNRPKPLSCYFRRLMNSHELLFIEFSRSHFYLLWNVIRFSELFVNEPPCLQPKCITHDHK